MARPVNQAQRVNVLRGASLLLLPLFLIAVPVWRDDGFMHEGLELLGLALLLIGVFGRMWSILYVGGRKNGEVVTDGPYSLTRNPLYVFSSIAAFGVGLYFGAVTLALILGGTVAAILYVTARREAVYLRATFGQDYAHYAAEVPFFVPRLHGYHSEQIVPFSPGALRRNVRDALVFLCFIPLAELVEWLHASLHIWNLPLF